MFAFELNPLPKTYFFQQSKEENSKTVRDRVKRAQTLQLKKFGKLNHHLSGKNLESSCMLSNKNQKILQNSLEKFQLSTRAIIEFCV